MGEFVSSGVKWKSEFGVGNWRVFGKSDGDPPYLSIRVGWVVGLNLVDLEGGWRRLGGEAGGGGN